MNEPRIVEPATTQQSPFSMVDDFGVLDEQDNDVLLCLQQQEINDKNRHDNRCEHVILVCGQFWHKTWTFWIKPTSHQNKDKYDIVL